MNKSTKSIAFMAITMLFVLSGCFTTMAAEGQDGECAKSSFGIKQTAFAIVFDGGSYNMKLVKGGTFIMGASATDTIALGDEKPTHQVALDDFYIGETEVTQALWEAVMGDNPSEFKGDSVLLPVETVSWDDCQIFIAKLDSLTGQKFSLPTEAQWEFAARGGNDSQGYEYIGSNDYKAVAWYKLNSESQTQPVATKEPNELGIYDMAGNVSEWCSDWGSNIYYFECESQGVVHNPMGPKTGTERVCRGGDWLMISDGCRPSYRGLHLLPNERLAEVGLRLVLNPND